MIDSAATGNVIWPEGPPREEWHSFDSTPWLHPSLTRINLETLRKASIGWRDEARRAVEASGGPMADRKFAFVGNMANGMYGRARSLAQSPLHIDVFGLEGDDSVFSDPRWEEYNGVLPDGLSYVGDNKEFLAGIAPKLSYAQLEISAEFHSFTEETLPAYIRQQDFIRFQPYMAHAPALKKLQEYDAVFATQRPLMGYLSGRPYLTTQVGGDIWLEAARDDMLGRLQRMGFREASCILVSNPWTYAHARRYGFNNLVYLPLTLNEVDYSPGPAAHRQAWEATGGNFFVLATSRSDNYYKASALGIRGFAQFSARNPGARLVLVSWGEDLEKTRASLAPLGIVDKTIFVPLSGKRRMVEYLRSADCLLDQFRLGYYGATALEAAACSLPVVMRVDKTQYDALSRTGAPPFLSAESSNDVANILEDLHSNLARGSKVAATHRQWFLDNHSGECWRSDFEAVLHAVALGHRFSFENSPLSEPLSQVERLYHAEQLALAPKFPSYDFAVGSGTDLRGHPSAYPETLEVATRAYRSTERIELGLTAFSQTAREQSLSARLQMEEISTKLKQIDGKTSNQLTELPEKIVDKTASQLEQISTRLDGNISTRLNDLVTSITETVVIQSQGIVNELNRIDGKSTSEVTRVASVAVEAKVQAHEGLVLLHALAEQSSETGLNSRRQNDLLLERLKQVQANLVDMEQKASLIFHVLDRSPSMRIRRVLKSLVARGVSGVRRMNRMFRGGGEG